MERLECPLNWSTMSRHLAFPYFKGRPENESTHFLYLLYERSSEVAWSKSIGLVNYYKHVLNMIWKVFFLAHYRL